MTVLPLWFPRPRDPLVLALRLLLMLDALLPPLDPPRDPTDPPRRRPPRFPAQPRRFPRWPLRPAGWPLDPPTLLPVPVWVDKKPQSFPLFSPTAPLVSLLSNDGGSGCKSILLSMEVLAYILHCILDCDSSWWGVLLPVESDYIW